MKSSPLQLLPNQHTYMYFEPAYKRTLPQIRLLFLLFFFIWHKIHIELFSIDSYSFIFSSRSESNLPPWTRYLCSIYCVAMADRKFRSHLSHCAVSSKATTIKWLQFNPFSRRKYVDRDVAGNRKCCDTSCAHSRKEIKLKERNTQTI